MAVSYDNDNIIIRQLYTFPDECDKYILHACSKEGTNIPDMFLDNIEIYGVVKYTIHPTSYSNLQ